MENLSSETLMLKCKEGDLRAFDVLMKRHQRGLVIYLREKLLDASPENLDLHRRSHADIARAEDLTQETFLRAFNARERYVPTAKFTTWLYHIALNLYRDEIRRRSRQPVVSISKEFTYETADGEYDTYELHEAIPDESVPSAQEVLEQEEREALLATAMASLGPKHRDILTLRYHEELDYAEIAQYLRCSIGTVKSRLYYASRALRCKLKQEDPLCD